MIEALKRAIEKSGVCRLRYAMPSLVFQCHRLSLQLITDANAVASEIALLHLVHSTITHFTKQESILAESALHLYTCKAG